MMIREYDLRFIRTAHVCKLEINPLSERKLKTSDSQIKKEIISIIGFLFDVNLYQFVLILEFMFVYQKRTFTIIIRIVYVYAT